MKRSTACVVLGLIVSCSNVPPQLDGGSGGGSISAGGGSGGGLGGAGGGAAGGIGGGDAGGTGGMGGGAGGGAANDAGCATACDCAPGYSCYNDQCLAGTVAVYCCSGPLCPSGEFCQQPTGPFEQCAKDAGVGDGGMKDAGTPLDAGRPDGGRSDAGCDTACDCAAGLACVGKRCFASTNPVYCCGGATCPPPGLCQYPSGQYSQCGFDGGIGPFDAGRGDGGMKRCATACDCTPGQLCAGGQCITGFAPLWCCGAMPCPTGNACQSDGGQYGVCP